MKSQVLLKMLEKLQDIRHTRSLLSWRDREQMHTQINMFDKFLIVTSAIRSFCEGSIIEIGRSERGVLQLKCSGTASQSRCHLEWGINTEKKPIF